MISLFDKRIAWVNSFLAQREKMARMFGQDLWIREVLALLESEDACPHCHQALQQKARIMERVTQKLLRYGSPVISVVQPTSRDESDAGEP